MEFVQCTSCHKKYAVNDKVRNNIGRVIKCSACKNTFPIVIQHATPQIAAETSYPSKEASAETPNKTQLKKFRLALPKWFKNLSSQERKQLYISAALLLTLIVGVSTLPFLSQKPDENHVRVTTQNSTVEIAEKPISSSLRTKEEGNSNALISLERENASCKEAAAAQWLNDMKIIHSMYSNDEYMNLLDSGQEFSESIRSNCDNEEIVHHILQAARDRKEPIGISAEIKKLEYRSLDLIFPVQNNKEPKLELIKKES